MAGGMKPRRICEKQDLKAERRRLSRVATQRIAENGLDSFLRREKGKLRKEALRLLAAVRRLSSSRAFAHPGQTDLRQLVRAVTVVRCRAYESLNQIPHHYAVILAAEWLLHHNPPLREHEWRFHFRQTGGKETDIRVGKNLVLAEVTTSREPVGTIATGMRRTMEKLVGERNYYFVVSPEMKGYATEVKEQLGNHIVVKLLDENDFLALDCRHCDFRIPGAKPARRFEGRT